VVDEQADLGIAMMVMLTGPSGWMRRAVFLMATIRSIFWLYILKRKKAEK
jgi:hypothetical protein